MKKAIPICFLIFASLVANAQEASNQTDESFPKIVLIGSSAALGVTYVATIIGDATTGGKIDFPEIFIPGIGPLIAFARYDSYVSQSYSTASGRDTQKILLLASGFIQSISIGGIVYGFISLGNIQKNREDDSSSRLSLEPCGFNGMKVVFRY